MTVESRGGDKVLAFDVLLIFLCVLSGVLVCGVLNSLPKKAYGETKKEALIYRYGDTYALRINITGCRHARCLHSTSFS
jgi:hypothetical protein